MGVQTKLVEGKDEGWQFVTTTHGTPCESLRTKASGSWPTVSDLPIYACILKTHGTSTCQQGKPNTAHITHSIQHEIELRHGQEVITITAAAANAVLLPTVDHRRGHDEWKSRGMPTGGVTCYLNWAATVPAQFTPPQTRRVLKLGRTGNDYCTAVCSLHIKTI